MKIRQYAKKIINNLDLLIPFRTFNTDGTKDKRSGKRKFINGVYTLAVLVSTIMYGTGAYDLKETNPFKWSEAKEKERIKEQAKMDTYNNIVEQEKTYVCSKTFLAYDKDDSGSLDSAEFAKYANKHLDKNAASKLGKQLELDESKIKTLNTPFYKYARDQKIRGEEK